MDRIALYGRGLHSGESCYVSLEREAGPVRLRHRGRTAGCDEVEVVRADRGVRVRTASTGLEVDLVEHLFSALAGLRIHSGLEVELSGPEVPLLDGAALEWVHALQALELEPQPPRLEIVEAHVFELDGSRYELEPGPDVRVEVYIDFPGLEPERAAWDGSREGFVSDIAPARTFGFSAEAEALRAAGRASWVEPSRVLVLDDRGQPLPPAQREPGELARHKLLDFVGDSYIYGGPPVGTVRCSKPGHRKNHDLLRAALREGWVRPRVLE